MRKWLSIVIPRCKETEAEIFPLLSSISGQVGIDFSDIEVIIANDGKKETTPLNDDFLSWFEFDIKQITCEVNRGCGPARQAGFDIAQGAYLLCCDADDTLHNVGVLGALMQEAEKSAPDMLTTNWLEEIKNENGQYSYVPHEKDTTWMHGKLYRRHFLIQNGIRFPDSLRVQEDSYFNGLAVTFAEKRIHIPITSYVWKYNPASTTRQNGGSYTYESIPDFICSCILSYKEIEKRMPEQMEYKIIQFTLYNYFIFHQPVWKEAERADDLKNAETAFVKHIKPFWHYWKNASLQAIAEIYNQERLRSFGGCVEQETVWEWLGRIGLDSN